jgi:hypothetical protein
MARCRSVSFPFTSVNLTEFVSVFPFFTEYEWQKIRAVALHIYIHINSRRVINVLGLGGN